MRKNLIVRHRATKAVRDYFDAQGFIEVETPALFKSTPEGARRNTSCRRASTRGSFYRAVAVAAAVQNRSSWSPAWRNISRSARCFRDEDLRADRQMEFTQIDVEASFVDREDIYALFEGMLKKIWKEILAVDIPTPFLRMPFVEAMNRFGVDKPDLRFGLELADFSDTFQQSGFKVFQTTIASGGVVKALNGKGLADVTQGELKNLEDIAKSLGAKGLAFIKIENGRMEIADRQVFSTRPKRRRCRNASALPMATSFSSPRHRGRKPARSSAASASSVGPCSRSAANSPSAPTTGSFCGSWIFR